MGQLHEYERMYVMEHVCVVCGHVHDEATEGKWEDLPADFECPECGVGKDDYESIWSQQSNLFDFNQKVPYNCPK